MKNKSIRKSINNKILKCLKKKTKKSKKNKFAIQGGTNTTEAPEILFLKKYRKTRRGTRGKNKKNSTNNVKEGIYRHTDKSGKFGFIEDSFGNDIFVHISDIIKGITIRNGDRVKYTVKEYIKNKNSNNNTKKAIKAINVYPSYMNDIDIKNHKLQSNLSLPILEPISQLDLSIPISEPPISEPPILEPLILEPPISEPPILESVFQNTDKIYKNKDNVKKVPITLPDGSEIIYIKDTNNKKKYSLHIDKNGLTTVLNER